LKKVIRKVMAIGYLPVLLVRQNFHLLRTSRRTMRLCRFPELTLNQRKTLANVFFTELIRSTDNFRLILLLHNVQKTMKEKMFLDAFIW
jgi:hypothetical protein